MAVFPTPVGVFLAILGTLQATMSLPHTRGGVSITQELEALVAQSSPHPWGCFLHTNLLRCLSQVFPTPVGVFLRLR